MKREAEEEDVGGKMSCKRDDDDAASTSPSYEIRPIFHRRVYEREVEPVDFVAVHVEEKAKISELVPLLPPLAASYAHLRRVKEGKVLIAPAAEADDCLHKVRELLGEHFKVETVKVPSRIPLTQAQYFLARELWGTHFHYSKDLEEALSGKNFSSEDHVAIAKFREHAQTQRCVIVRNGEIIVEGCEGKRKLDHPASTAIDRLARRQHSLPRCNEAEYLATGCDVFLDLEPCAMCAMSLVHGRARRVFFNRPSTTGVLVSGSWQLHLEPRLNHHYKVFALFGPDAHADQIRCGQL